MFCGLFDIDQTNLPGGNDNETIFVLADLHLYGCSHTSCRKYACFSPALCHRRSMLMFETEFAFTLPRGYVDFNGVLHREGVMRLANAADEIVPLRDPRVQQNPGYLSIIILSRVITKLGTMPAVDTKVVEGMYTMDLAYLQDLYAKINTMDMPVYKSVCPHCGEAIEIPVNFLEAGI